MPHQTPSSVRLSRIVAFLGAVCFFLSAIEYAVPKPLPFMRLGIANLPILIAVDLLPFRWYMVLAVVKVIGMSVVSGTLFSYIAVFSFAGTLASAMTMFGARRLMRRAVTRIGLGTLGAMASNGIQIALASVFVFGPSAALTAPLFLGMGLVTGVALGAFAERFVPRSKWYAMIAEDSRAG